LIAEVVRRNVSLGPKTDNRHERRYDNAYVHHIGTVDPTRHRENQGKSRAAGGFQQHVKSAGGEVKAFYMVTGRYDILAVTEAPSDDVMAKVVLARASKGWIRTETLRVFTEDEYRKIIAALP
jgi:uncharacterized protein with GYD domain